MEFQAQARAKQPFSKANRYDGAPIVEVASSQVDRRRGLQIAKDRHWPHVKDPFASRKRTSGSHLKARNATEPQQSRDHKGSDLSRRTPELTSDNSHAYAQETNDSDNLSLLINSLRRVYLEYSESPQQWVPLHIHDHRGDWIDIRGLEVTYRSTPNAPHSKPTSNIHPIDGRPGAVADKPIPSQWPGFVYFEIELLHEPLRERAMMVGYLPIKQGRAGVQGCHLTAKPEPELWQNHDDNVARNFNLHCAAWGHPVGCGVDFDRRRMFYTWNGVLIGKLYFDSNRLVTDDRLQDTFLLIASNLLCP